jgi:hypothetical protein
MSRKRLNKRWGLIERDTGLRADEEGLLSGVKRAWREVAPGTHAGSVVVNELVPFCGVKGKEKKGTRD